MSDMKLPDWIEDHLRKYLESDGAEGHIWNGVPTLLLTTMGRTTRQPRTIPLIYGRDGDHYVIVASRGGSPEHPGWYKNLRVEPLVDVQVGPEKFRARSRTATGAERERLWKEMARIWPAYDDYQRSTSRQIPVVVLERT
ncbi:MAG TPA: nitroreductase family deazaflavin-dependent oxidoreductase [Candidatus Limnocylindrales bacterium]|nr:nitroreductase family deazaflavin-dependent oxidoreductase [Candidatus Limnocylindrales bacterium]